MQFVVNYDNKEYKFDVYVNEQNTYVIRSDDISNIAIADYCSYDTEYNKTDFSTVNALLELKTINETNRYKVDVPIICDGGQGHVGGVEFEGVIVEKTTGGGMKKTDEKVLIGKRLCCVYKKPKDRKKYVRMNGSYLPVSEAKRRIVKK